MFYTQWEVLLVDDEPDVLSVSKLAMKGFKVYGLPLRIHAVESKAQAIELLNSRPEMRLGLSVAFIDVVMESDSAGLELCEYIREEMGNRLTQLFIRTGQPGVAPERDVMDRYDINGYFTKLETTEDKLYSLVKSGVRQHFWSTYSLLTLELIDTIIANSDTREKIAENLRRAFGGHAAGVEGGHQSHRQFKMGDTIITSRGDQETVIGLLDKLNKLEGRPLSPYGDKYVRDEDDYQLVKIAAQPSMAETHYLYHMTFDPPEFVITTLHRFLRSVATLWAKAE